MKNFEITTNRTLTTRVVIEADSQADAEAKYQDMVANGDMSVLESEQGDETYSEYFVVDKSVVEPSPYNFWEDGGNQDGKEYARKCDITGEGMNKGWVADDGDKYFKYETDAIAHCRDAWGLSLEEAFATDSIYYTDWSEDESDYEYIYVGGILFEKL